MRTTPPDVSEPHASTFMIASYDLRIVSNSVWRQEDGSEDLSPSWQDRCGILPDTVGFTQFRVSLPAKHLLAIVLMSFPGVQIWQGPRWPWS